MNDHFGSMNQNDLIQKKFLATRGNGFEVHKDQSNHNRSDPDKNDE